MSDWALLFSCEHGGNDVPPAYAPLFAGRRALLDSHRGFDLGALETAKILAAALKAPLFPAVTTRLLVDLNRSIGNPNLFSAITKPLPTARRQDILTAHYYPHRTAVARALAHLLTAGKTVLHVASHSFTPILNGNVRRCDVGLLYDPRRAKEKDFCRSWMRELAVRNDALILRRNFPYKGVSDGLVTAFRRQFGEQYVGVELEVNQRFLQEPTPILDTLRQHLAEALQQALSQPTIGS